MVLTVIVKTMFNIWLQKVPTVSLLNHSLVELQSSPFAKWCQKAPCWTTSFQGEDHCTGVYSQCRPMASEQFWSNTLGIKLLLFLTPATQLRNQYIVIWSTLLRDFWRFINKTKQQQQKINSSTDIFFPWIFSSPKTFLQVSQRILLPSSWSGLISHVSSYWGQGLLKGTGECHKSE